ncbi:MAG: hypothetical protein FJ271_18940 [Planctomycetes bacterium]|nr:hypothetical protein [Planctomycetota bacterium]
MVFIGTAAIRSSTGENSFDLPEADLHVFGGRKPVPDSELPSHLRNKGLWQMEFKVLEHRLSDLAWIEHGLSQHDDLIPWSKATDMDDCLNVDMMRKEDFRCLRRKPRWKASDASWPAMGKRPMVFVTQWPLPDSQAAKTFLVSGSAIFLFVDREESGDLNVKMWMQEMRSQTAEEHYRAEELMAKLEANPGDPAVIDQCVREGDQYVHEYMIEKKGTPRHALQLLAKQAKSKKLRDTAARLLRDTQ